MKHVVARIFMFATNAPMRHNSISHNFPNAPDITQCSLYENTTAAVSESDATTFCAR